MAVEIHSENVNSDSVRGIMLPDQSILSPRGVRLRDKLKR